jgi:hypothetical protein
MKLSIVTLITILLGLVALKNRDNSATSVLSLAGQWDFSLDRNDSGIAEKWYNRKFDQKITLPGSLAENNYGDDPSLTTPWVGNILDSAWFKDQKFAKYRTPNNFKPPMWLTPKKYYSGVAWYQKDIVIPQNWKGKSIELFLERCHWETQVWIDDQKVGVQNSLGTPHVYDLSEKLTPGKHRVSIRVNNNIIIDVGLNSHSISDHTQSNWNGIVGKIELRAYSPIRIRSLKISPDIGNKKADVKIYSTNKSGKLWKGKLILSAKSSNGKVLPEIVKVWSLRSSTDSASISYNVGTLTELWSEFNPVTYTLSARLESNNGDVIDTFTDVFGMRDFKVEGKQIKVNGTPVFLRGTLECAIFPLTGYPSMEKSYWQKIFETCRKHGLNHVRFHSWCPPEVAFTVADEMGFYLQIECGSWANQSTTIGDGKPVDRFVMEESDRIVEKYGNHPSFCMMTYGNEPGGPNHKKYLASFVSYWKNKDNRRIYTSGAGWPLIPESDYHSDPNPRIQRWNEGLKSIINAEAPRTNYDWSERIKTLDKPMVSHEIGQWCVFPNFNEIKKYTGVLQPRNFELFKETLEANSMGGLADDFLQASGKLQTLCYKADIEAALRTPGFGGFQLLDLHDFPGQGTALVGVLDAFWDEKGYVTPEAYSRFCSETVPLARLSKMVYQTHETFSASVEFAHFGAKPLESTTVYWKLINPENNTEVAQGKWNNITLGLGNNQKIGDVEYKLQGISVATKLKFVVGIEGSKYENDWEIWVYPTTSKIPATDIVVATQWNEKAKTALNNGKKVLLVLEKNSVKPEKGGDVAVGFSSIFWNTSWTRGQAPHTMGILCDPKHEVFKDFPTDFHSNWQWWELIHGSQAMVLDDLSPSLDPAVKLIDTWFKNRRLALLFEANIGKGKLIVSSMDLLTSHDSRPAARQLYYSIAQYMQSDKFNPQVNLRQEDISALANQISNTED